MLDLSVDDDIPDQYRIILRLKDRTIDKILPTTTFQADNPGPRDFMKVRSIYEIRLFVCFHFGFFVYLIVFTLVCFE